MSYPGNYQDGNTGGNWSYPEQHNYCPNTAAPHVTVNFLNYPPPAAQVYPPPAVIPAYPPPLNPTNYNTPPPPVVYGNTSVTNYHNAYPPTIPVIPPPNYPPHVAPTVVPTHFTQPPPPIPGTIIPPTSYPSSTYHQSSSESYPPTSRSDDKRSPPRSSYSRDSRRSRSYSPPRRSRRYSRSRSRSRSPRRIRRRSRSRSRSRTPDRRDRRSMTAFSESRKRDSYRSSSYREISRSVTRRPSPPPSSYPRRERVEERRPSRRPPSRERHPSSRPTPTPVPQTPAATSNATTADKEVEEGEVTAEVERKWTRSTPADLFYVRDMSDGQVVRGTPRLADLCNQFDNTLVKRAEVAREGKPSYKPPPHRHKAHLHKCKGAHAGSSSSSSSCSDESSSEDEEDCAMRELERKRLHPARLHSELWFNDPGEMNDGPLCRCSAKARRSGIRHGIYAGENPLPACDPESNNGGRLHHYRITISPPTNFLTKVPTIICYDQHEFIFEGFSMFSHSPLARLPTCKVIRFNIQYTIQYVEEKAPENFTIRELDLFFDYLFRELLELIDLDFRAAGDKTGCPRFHFMPRFVRDLPDNGIEILSMNQVLSFLLSESRPLVEEESLASLLQMPQFEWQNLADQVKGMLVTYPGMKPCSLRVDQIDREQKTSDFITYPEIVHFGIRPPQLSYAGNPEYQREWREYVKLRHLLANMPKPSFEDKRRLEGKENRLQEMRMQSRMKRDVTVAVSAQGFYRTGIMCDVIQHAMLIPVLVCHLRFHQSLDKMEEVIGYKFENRYLLQLALTHPSYRENFGTNPDHARNSLTNCGIRQPEYGDRRIHYLNTRKRGINTLINIMSRFGKKCETESNITHNERLEFLGDAVVEFLSSIHLFFMFPDLEEGGLATYRAAIVQNQHLAVLARTLKLEEYMLYAHGSDLCHDLELRHAMANCFEALMGALFLDGGIKVADKVFGETFFRGETKLLDVWVNCPKHPLQEQEPHGDRHWITQFPLLMKLTEFEDSIGVQFTHIRLLARAFTDRSIGYNNLTLGSNQRLEFLGDTVLQLIASDYLYKHFPEHHEGHLSLLRSSLVNNRTQSVVCDDLGMTGYALYSNPKAELKTKDRADLLEAFLGALYVDKDMEYCLTFCDVCFFPRLQDFIMNQDWNDPKSKLQQCCLTLRTMDGGEPDIPIYKVIECKGPTNTRIYTVAVYFRGERLATATGHSIQQAEMNAAKSALDHSEALFPQLNHQKRVIAKSMKKQRRPIQYRFERSPSRAPESTRPVGVRPQQYRSERSPSRQSESRSSVARSDISRSVARSDISRSDAKTESRSKTDSKISNAKHESAHSVVKHRIRESKSKSTIKHDSVKSGTKKKASRKAAKYNSDLISNVKIENVDCFGSVAKSTQKACKREEPPEFDPIDSADGIRSIGGELEEGEIVKSDLESDLEMG